MLCQSAKSERHLFHIGEIDYNIISFRRRLQRIEHTYIILIDKFTKRLIRFRQPSRIMLCM